MKKMNVMPTVLRIIRVYMKSKENKGSSLSLILLEHVLHILSLLAPRMEKEFVKCKSTLM